MATSAWVGDATNEVAVAVLLAATGSLPAVVATVTVIVVDATAPAAKVPLGWQVITPVAWVQAQPVSVPRETNVTLAGRVSVSVVALPAATEPGPLLVTERVKVSVPPSRTGFGMADVETERSV